MKNLKSILLKKALIMYRDNLSKSDKFLNLFDTGLIIDLNKIQISIIESVLKDKKKNGKESERTR